MTPIELFGQELLRMPDGSRITLSSHQQELLTTGELLKAPRQVGKTVGLAIAALYHAWWTPGTCVLYVAGTPRQVDDWTKLVFGMLHASPLLNPMLTLTGGRSEFRLTNGSRIITSQVRDNCYILGGYGAHVALLDEPASWGGSCWSYLSSHFPQARCYQAGSHPAYEVTPIYGYGDSKPKAFIKKPIEGKKSEFLWMDEAADVEWSKEIQFKNYVKELKFPTLGEKPGPAKFDEFQQKLTGLLLSVTALPANSLGALESYTDGSSLSSPSLQDFP